MLLDTKQFVKDHLGNMILLITVILISLLSFALGYIWANYHQKSPLEFEYYEQKTMFLSNSSLVIHE